MLANQAPPEHRAQSLVDDPEARRRQDRFNELDVRMRGDELNVSNDEKIEFFELQAEFT